MSPAMTSLGLGINRQRRGQAKRPAPINPVNRTCVSLWMWARRAI